VTLAAAESGHTMNPAMKRVYEKCGYQHEGTARRMFWRNGRWHDAELFAVLADD
jgi:RimJ/RimL family protein N-acetyltransferase